MQSGLTIGLKKRKTFRSKRGSAWCISQSTAKYWRSLDDWRIGLQHIRLINDFLWTCPYAKWVHKHANYIQVKHWSVFTIQTKVAIDTGELLRVSKTFRIQKFVGKFITIFWNICGMSAFHNFNWRSSVPITLCLRNTCSHPNTMIEASQVVNMMKRTIHSRKNNQHNLSLTLCKT